jgi:hypothetical protein
MKGVMKMVNENHKRFQQEQRDLKNRYIGDGPNNRKKSQSNLDYNSGRDTDMSPGATGRE